jgi:hypothetical protein
MAKRYLEPEGLTAYREGCDWDYDDPEFSTVDARNPLEEYIGCNGVSIIDTADRSGYAQYEMELFDCDEDEDPVCRALHNIGTNLLVAAACAEHDVDVGVVVSVSGNSETTDFGSMIDDIIKAETAADLQEILSVYKDVPGAKELAEACAQKLGNGRRLFAVAV